MSTEHRMLPLMDLVRALDGVSTGVLWARKAMTFNDSVPPGAVIPDEFMSAWRDHFWRGLIIDVALRSRTEPTKKTGTVYLAESDGLLKIGFTVRPVQERMRQLSSGRAADVTLIASFPGTFNDEHFTHLRFAEHRHRGEWFRDAAEIRDYFAEKSVSS